MPVIKVGDYGDYRLEDLNLDLNLTVVRDETCIDYTGRKTFDIGFFKKSIGFGITDINVDITTSLQPIITISFKDLYGNTIYKGLQRQGQHAGLDDVDYSSVFDWPPPKFIFSFKGYLGRKVTWILNLKSIKINYEASDGSHSLVADFVPNQWGFYADMPFAYLYAAPYLRGSSFKENANKNSTDLNADYDNSPEAVKRKSQTSAGIESTTTELDSVISLERIGKEVKIVEKEKTAQYDSILEDLAILKSSAYQYVKLYSEFEEETIETKRIIGFQTIIVPKIEKEIFRPKEGGKFETAANLPSFNAYVLSRLKIGGKEMNLKKTLLEDFKKMDSVKLEAFMKSVKNIIQEQIAKIEKQIEAESFEVNESKLGKITIKEVFSLISRDSSYILGSILKAGALGYKENIGLRKNADELIGKHFPLIVKNGKEVPAVCDSFLEFTDTESSNSQYGVEQYEMALVDKFIKGIGEAAVQLNINDKILSDAAGPGISEVNPLGSRAINMLEILRPNPYKAELRNIQSNIIIRSGIAAFVTRSSDITQIKDGGDPSISDIIALIEKTDVQNISKAVIGGLSEEDRFALSKWCSFWLNAIEKKGDFNEYDDLYLKDEDGKALNGPYDRESSPVGDINESLSGSPLYIKQVPLDPETFGDATMSLMEALKPVYDNPEYESQDICAGGLGAGTFFTDFLVHNGVVYRYPQSSNSTGYLAGVLFAGADANTASDLIPAQNVDAFFSRYEPEGVLKFEDANEEDATIIDALNDRFIPGGFVLDYEKMIAKVESVYVDEYIERTTPQQTNGISYALDMVAVDITGSVIVKFEAGKAYTPYSQVPKKSESNGAFLVNGLYFDDSGNDRGYAQRAAVKRLCEHVVELIVDIEKETLAIKSRILGGGTEYTNAIYKQMHIIFHQWNTLRFTDPEVGIGNLSKCPSITEKNSETFDDDFEKEGSESHISRKGNTAIADILKGVETDHASFIYDFPLQNLKELDEPVDVGNALINISPMYNSNIQSNTTVLNVFQQICTKNNFTFIPFPGDGLSNDVKDIFNPFPDPTDTLVKNYFHVIFTPTPESRTNSAGDKKEDRQNFNADAFEVQYGSPNNKIFHNISVGTDENKPTAESIINIQRLVDNENQNDKVTKDCSMLSVYEGRSYLCKVDVIGTAQIYPMQYFYLNKMPLFDGLYQILKVKHNLTANNMKTSLEGIRMRFSSGSGGYAAVPPETLNTKRKSLLELIQVRAEHARKQQENQKKKDYNSTDEFIGGYDDSRSGDVTTDIISGDRINSRETKYLVPVFKEFADKFIAELKTELDEAFGYSALIISTYRNFPEQQALYNQGRTTEGMKVTNSGPGRSYHNWMRAVDVVPTTGDGREVLWDAPANVWAKMREIGFRVGAELGLTKTSGLGWGGDWTSFLDKPHWEWKGGDITQDGSRTTTAKLLKQYPNGLDDSTYITDKGNNPLAGGE